MWIIVPIYEQSFLVFLAVKWQTKEEKLIESTSTFKFDIWIKWNVKWLLCWPAEHSQFHHTNPSEKNLPEINGWVAQVALSVIVVIVWRTAASRRRLSLMRRSNECEVTVLRRIQWGNSKIILMHIQHKKANYCLCWDIPTHLCAKYNHITLFGSNFAYMRTVSDVCHYRSATEKCNGLLFSFHCHNLAKAKFLIHIDPVWRAYQTIRA